MTRSEMCVRERVTVCNSFFESLLVLWGRREWDKGIFGNLNDVFKKEERKKELHFKFAALNVVMSLGSDDVSFCYF